MIPSTKAISTTYLHLLSCHNTLLKGFRSSRGRSNTLRSLWSFQIPRYAYKNEQADMNTILVNLQMKAGT